MKYKKFITIMQAALGVAPLNKRELIPPPRKLWKPAREWYSSEVYVLRHWDGFNTHCLHSQQYDTLSLCVAPCHHQDLLSSVVSQRSI